MSKAGIVSIRRHRRAKKGKSLFVVKAPDLKANNREARRLRLKQAKTK